MKRTYPFSIVLGSSSPRRKELLAGLGLNFSVLAPRIEEKQLPGEAPETFARRLARDKAAAVAGQLHDDMQYVLVITADTIVVVDERIMGKPESKEVAETMLHSLSGRSHRVMTGMHFLLWKAGAVISEKNVLATTEVTFKALTSSEIEAYIATGEPLDKAGAYGIQGRANYMVKSIRGSYTNVVGLPLCELVDVLDHLP